MRAYIEKHKTEFHEPIAGDQEEDEDEELETGGSITPTTPAVANTSEESWLRTKLGPAAPLIDIAEAAKGMLMGLSAMQMATVGLIVLLVLSNLWTLGSDRASSNNGPRRSAAEQQRSPDQVASAVRDVLQEYFAAGPSSPSKALTFSEERIEIVKILDELDVRIARLRKELTQ